MRAGGWDVVVVGAGPAGSATALRLARTGHAVLICDRNPPPRRKACGECLNPGAVAELESLLPGLAYGPGFAPLSGWRVSAPGGREFRGAFPADREGRTVPRIVLDRHLFEAALAAGCAFSRARVEAPLASGGRVVGVRAEGEAVRGRWVVAGDGLRSVLASRLGLVRRPPRLRKIALTAHVRGAGAEPGWGRMRVVEGGCVGAAPLAGGEANVVVVLDAERWKAGARAAEVFDAALGRAEGPGAARVEPVLTTGPFDRPVRARTAPGLLLVGDAAGYYDPFTGQGIRRALASARLAATAIDSAAGGRSEAAARRGYAREFRRRVRRGSGVQRLIETAVARPVLFDGAARVLAAAPTLADALVRRTGDLPEAPTGNGRH